MAGPEERDDHEEHHLKSFDDFVEDPGAHALMNLPSCSDQIHDVYQAGFGEDYAGRGFGHIGGIAHSYAHPMPAKLEPFDNVVFVLRINLSDPVAFLDESGSLLKSLALRILLPSPT